MGNYVRDLLAHLVSDSTFEFVVYLDPHCDGSLVPDRENVVVRWLPALPYAFTEQVVLPLACIGDRIDILHAPANTAPLLMPRSSKLVVTVHDTIFMRGLFAGGSLYQTLGRWYRRLVVPRVAKRAEGLMTISNHAAAAIEKSVGIDQKRLDVIYHGPPSDKLVHLEAARADHAADESSAENTPYFLFLGAIDPRKNTARVLRAFADFAERVPEVELRVVGLRPEQLPIPVKTQTGDATRRVRALGFVSDEELAGLYAGAIGLLYVSLQEGFGLPALEAMTAQCPVVFSKNSAVEEVVGGAGLAINANSDEAVVEAMLLLRHDAALRADLARRGLERVRAFSWDAAAERQRSVYRRVAACAL